MFAPRLAVPLAMSRRGLASLTRVSREEGVEHITLAQPKTRNALSLDMMLQVGVPAFHPVKSMVLQLTEDLARAGADREVRAIVLRGEGKVIRQGGDCGDGTDGSL